MVRTRTLKCTFKPVSAVELAAGRASPTKASDNNQNHASAEPPTPLSAKQYDLRGVGGPPCFVRGVQNTFSRLGMAPSISLLVSSTQVTKSPASQGLRASIILPPPDSLRMPP